MTIHKVYATKLLNKLICSEHITIDLKNISYSDMLNDYENLLPKCIFIKDIVEHEGKKNIFNLKSYRTNHRCTICNHLLSISNLDLIDELTFFLKKYITEIKENEDNILSLKQLIDFIEFIYKNVDVPLYEKFLQIDKNNLLKFYNKCSIIKILNDIEKISKCKMTDILNKYKNSNLDNCIFCKCICNIFEKCDDTELNSFFEIFKTEYTIDDTYIIYLNDKKPSLLKRIFSLFRKNAYFTFYKECQLYNLFKTEDIFIKLKKNNYFTKLIGMIRYSMLPVIFDKTNCGIYGIKDYDKLCNMKIKDWKIYYKKYIKSFFKLKCKSKFGNLDLFYDFYTNTIKQFKKYSNSNKYPYIKNVDTTSLLECFIYTHIKLNQDYNEILNILQVVNEINNFEKLKKFIYSDYKIELINNTLGNIVQDWVYYYKNIDILMTNIKEEYNKNEYSLEYLYDLDFISSNILENIYVETDLDYDDSEIYTPDTVQRLIDEMKK